MKIALLGDTHFGYRVDSEKFLQYITAFYRNQFFPYLLDNKIDTVIQFGDMMEDRRQISVKALQHMVQEFLNPLYENKIQMYTFLGNHDVVYNNTNELNSLQYILSMRPYDNITLFQSIEELELGGVKFAFVPWINKENQSEFQTWLKHTTAEVVCGHFEFKGFEYIRGNISARGFDTKGFGKFRHVFSGHYHHPSVKKNIRYLGTPYEMNAGDVNDEKGFYVYDTKQDQLEKIPNKLKLYYDIVYDDQAHDYSQLDIQQYQDSYVRVFVKSRQDASKFNRFMERIADQGVIDMFIYETDLSTVDVDIETLETETTFDIIEKTVKNFPDIPTEAILAKMQDLYQKAMKEQ